MPRIGVFVCQCGSNIAASVDTAKVVEAARTTMPGVVFATDYKYMCADPGQKMIQDAIKEHRLERVVVASCSPRMHEPTFRQAVAQAGMNPYLLEMANIREHCSWVHRDNKEVATDKATEIIRMIVAKVAKNDPLLPGRAPINKRLLVIGGGIAGIQAALDVANAGYEVVLVESSPTIGGKMAMLDKTFPTLDCSACILTPKMVDVARHHNIRLMTYAEVEKVSGFVGNFEVTIRQKARKIDHKLCTGCGICYSKCPQKKILSEFDQGMGTRTAVYVPFPQAVPGKPLIDVEHCRYMRYRKAQAQGITHDEEGKKLPECRICEKFCPTGAISWDQEDELITEKFGAVIVATGYEPFDARRIPHYGYGRLDNVITSLEFERLVNASGPTEGNIVLRDGVTEPKSVAIIHCVGSRDENYNEYCSKICCMYSLKFSHLLHEHLHGAEIYECYIDIRAGGKRYEEFYHRLLNEGTNFVRGRVAEVTNVPRTPEEEGKLIVQVYDTLFGKQRRIPVDMVILSVGIEASRQATQVAQLFALSHDANGFFVERHPKLDPVATMVDGVFVAGTCQGPMDIPDTVAQASASAAKVSALFSNEFIVTDPMTSIVDTAKCVACFLCEQVCPFHAVEHETLRNGKVVAKINESVCKGCGLCVAACRGNAITLRGFSDTQLLEELEALFRIPQEVG